MEDIKLIEDNLIHEIIHGESKNVAEVIANVKKKLHFSDRKIRGIMYMCFGNSEDIQRLIQINR